jgi:hypothetical protein
VLTPYVAPQIVESRRLAPHHRADLEASTIDFETAAVSGVSSINHAEAYDLGLRGGSDLSGLCFRYWEPTTRSFSTRFARIKVDLVVERRKYLQPVGEKPKLYFVPGTAVADLKDSRIPLLITEGEKKTLALHLAASCVRQAAAVVGVGGVWSWRFRSRERQPDGTLGRGRSQAIDDLTLIEWLDRVVYIIFDSDVLTNWKVSAAETALARELAERGARIRIVRLPRESRGGKLGIDDLLAAQGPEILPRLLADAWVFDGQPCPELIHLSDIENAAFQSRRLAIDLMVSAVGESYLLPRTLELSCHASDQRKPRLRLVRDDDDDGAAGSDDTPCRHSLANGGRWEHTLNDPRLLIDLTRRHAAKLDKSLEAYAKRLCDNAHYLGARTYQAATTFLATPKARRLRADDRQGSQQVLDEQGKPFREKVVYYLGTMPAGSRYFRGIGLAIPNPKTQEATAFLTRLTPLIDEFERFEVTPELATRFEAFQASAGQVWTVLQAIAEDITYYLTNIYGEHRMRSLIGKLLVYHSVRQFKFDGERPKRGWAEMLEVGDTGQGKTQQVDRLIQATGMGEGVDGVSTTRTGLAYSFQKYNETWYLVWGKYPHNDGRLLFIDEAQNLQPEDIDKIRKGRSDGVIAADGVRSGEHPTQTRLIATCNPRFQGVVDDQLFGIELVKQTFKDEDVRRFDFAIISSSSDVTADLNEPRVRDDGRMQRIPGDLLAASIKWAWSRTADQVEFAEKATQEVYAVAKKLSGLYGQARDIPLLLESDARHKIARLAVAMAALLHSTDETHQLVIVFSEHVKAVESFLTAIYTHSNCAFDLYARIRRDESDLSEADYAGIWAALEAGSRAADGEQADGPRLTEEVRANLLRAFVAHGGLISRQDLAGELGISPAWTSRLVRVLKTEKLIRVSHGRTGGYQGTPKFMRFLKLVIAKGDLSL